MSLNPNTISFVFLHLNQLLKLTETLTHLCLGSHKGTLANSVEPDQMPKKAGSDQVLNCMH